MRVLPHFTLDDEMYEVVRAALAHSAPDVQLSWEDFIDPKGWVLLPNPERPREPFYRAQRVLLPGHLSSPRYSRTIKVNVWYGPDLRRGERPWPHNHPWDHFSSRILLGGYEEERWQRRGGGLDIRRAEHGQGSANNVPHDVYHEVTGIFVPGRTVTLMDCGRSRGKGEWGYLDTETGLYIPYAQSPTKAKFDALYRQRNRHQL